MKRFVCEKCNAPIRKWNAVCYSCGYENLHLIRKLKTTRVLRALLVIVLTVGSIIILNANLLLPWQWGARRNKQVILEYAEQHYPNAEIVEQEFNSAHFFVWNNIKDCIVFKWEDVEFGITAESGDILIDGYYGARAIRQFDKIIQDGFLKPRGITAYTSYMFSDNYKIIYPYNGGLNVTITIWDQGSNPWSFDWLYDFYKYWKTESEFLKSYRVQIDIVENNETVYHINYGDDDEFPSEKAFYDAFNEGYMR